MSELFKQEIEQKIDVAVDNALERNKNALFDDESETEAIERHSKQLRDELKKSITEMRAEDLEITDEEWQEIFDSLPKDLMQEFGLVDGKELGYFVIFGENLSREQKILFKLEFPEIKTTEDLEQINSTLGQLEMDISELSSSSGDFFDSEEAMRHAVGFRKKLEALIVQVVNFINKKPPISPEDLKLAKKTKDIAENLCADFRNFENGGFFQKLKYDPIRDSGDKNDLRSLYTKYGIDKTAVKDFLVHGVDVALIDDYYKSRLLEEQFYPYIMRRIPPEVVGCFFNEFSDKEKSRLQNELFSDEVAEVIAIIATSGPPEPGKSESRISTNFITKYLKGKPVSWSSLDREELGKYYPELLQTHEVANLYNPEEKETKPVVTLNQIRLLYEKMPGKTDEEKLAVIKAYQDFDFSVEEALIAVAIPALSAENIQKEVQESGALFTAKDVFSIHTENVDIEDVKVFYKSLPEDVEKNVFTYVEIKKALPGKTIQEMAPYFRLLGKYNGTKWDAIIYFIENNVPLETVEEYKKAGMKGLQDIMGVMRDKIPLAYIKKLRDAGIKDVEGFRIGVWYMAKLNPKQIKNVYALVNPGKNGESWKELKPESVSAYYKWVDTNENRSQFNGLLNSGEKFDDALTMIVNGYKKEDIEFVRKYGLELNFIDTVKKYNLKEIASLFEAKGDPSDTIGNQLRYVVEVLDEGQSREDVLEMVRTVRADFDLHFALQIKKMEENWRDYLEYKEFFLSNSLSALRIVKFFNISPKNLKKYCKIYNGMYKLAMNDIDSVVASAYKEGDLPEDSKKFLDKYGIVFPSRYPISILRQMKEGYESPERQKKPTAILITGKNDWNGAFEGENPYEDLLKKYNIVIYEVANEREFVNAVKSFGEEQASLNKKITLMIIGGHGHPEGINFSVQSGEDSDLDIGDSEDLAGLGNYLDKDAKIILRSCSTGKGGSGANNVASTISKAFGGKKVIAPDRPTNIKSFKYDEMGERVIDVEYHDIESRQEILVR